MTLWGKFLPLQALNYMLIAFELLLKHFADILTVIVATVSKTIAKTKSISVATIKISGIGISRSFTIVAKSGVSICRDSIAVSSIAKTKSISISSIEKSSISLSLWLSVSRPFAIVSIGRITISNSSITKTSIAKSISITSIEKPSIGLSFSLGNMDGASRVGNISTSSSISTNKTRNSSRGSTSNAYSVGNIGHSISGSNRSSYSIAETSISSIQQTSVSISSAAA